MKYTIVAAALFAIMGTAAATNDKPSCQGNCPTTVTTGTPTQVTNTNNPNMANVLIPVITTKGGNADASAKSSATALTNVTNTVRTDISTSNTQGQLQGQVQGQLMEGSNNANVSVGGDTVVYERQAPAVFNSATAQPIRSCRLTMFGGVSRTDGSMSGGIPIGNDRTCLATVGVEQMMMVGGFSQEDMQKVTCTIEGMGRTKTCKDLKLKVAREKGYEGNDPYVIDRLNNEE